MRIIVAVLAIACWSASLQAQARAADEAVIRAQAVAVENAVNRRDAAALASLMTTDGDEIAGDGPRVAGQAAIRQAHQTEFAQLPATMRLSLTVTSIRFLGPDIAIAEAQGRVNEGAVRLNRATWVMARQNGTWLFAAVRVYPAQRQP